MENLDKAFGEALVNQQRKKAMLALEANIAFLLVSMNVEVVIKVLRDQAAYLEDHG